jgi:hypothetical protein
MREVMAAEILAAADESIFGLQGSNLLVIQVGTTAQVDAKVPIAVGNSELAVAGNFKRSVMLKPRARDSSQVPSSVAAVRSGDKVLFLIEKYIELR